MSREDIRMLVGGYASGTLTGEERRALMEAALEDQALFEELAREEPLRDLLSDPAARAHLLAALNDPAPAFYRRLGAWMRERAVGVAAVACFVAAAGYFAWQARFSNPDRIRLTVAEPTTVEVTAKALPRREFDVASASKAAARNMPPLPAPPPARPLLASNRQLNLPAFLEGPAALPPEPAITVTASASAVAAVAEKDRPILIVQASRPPASLAVSGASPMPSAGAARGGAAGGGGRGGRAGAADSGVVKEASARAQAAPAAMAPLQAVAGDLRTRSLLAASQEREAQQARQAVASKFDPAVAALAEHARTGAAFTEEDNRLTGNGEANLRLTLTSFAADSLEALRQAGFTVTRQSADDVEGHIAPAKLYGLAQLPFVASIQPQ